MTNHYKKLIVSLGVIATMLLAGCAHQDLKAPCPNFGDSCHQTPINHWNNN